MSSSSSREFADRSEGELESISGEGAENKEVVEEEVSVDSRCDDDDFEGDSAKRQKIELFIKNRADQQISFRHGPHRDSEASSKEDISKCKHDCSYAGICVDCGGNKDDKSGVAFGYVHKNLRLGNDEIPPLRDDDIKNLLRQKKLCLVLDLDHTLLNSASHHDMTLKQNYYLYKTPGAYQSVIKLPEIDMVTKLRPYVQTFLKEASKLFEMYIYTLGERGYALEMAKLLDPLDIYFNSKILAQEDCTQMHKKGLDIVLGKEKAVVILDDTEWVWEKHKENLMLIEKYHYFRLSRQAFVSDFKSLSERETDEVETDGPLASILRALQRVHSLFFDSERTDNLEDRDVREVLKTVRKEVLKGCRIAFSRIFPFHFPVKCREFLPQMPSI